MNNTTKGKQLAGTIMAYADHKNQAEITANIKEMVKKYDQETIQIAIEELESQNYNNEAEELFEARKNKRN